MNNEITVQIRHVPEEINYAAKAEALKRKMSLNSWYLETIQLRLANLALEDLKSNLNSPATQTANKD